MLLKGKKVEPPQPRTVEVRGNTFVCSAVMDFDEFEHLCPDPKPPLITKLSKTGGPPRQFEDTDSQVYKDKIRHHNELRTAWLILKSLSATPGLTWETVDLKDPSTWENYKTEMQQCFTRSEVDYIIVTVMEANVPDRARSDEAFRNFTQPTLAEGQAAAED